MAGKAVADSVLDALLDEVATCTQMDVTDDLTPPSNLTNSLADVTLTAGDGNGDYTIADGDTSGRKLTIAEQADVPIDGKAGENTARHIVLSLAGTVKVVTTCTEQSLTNGGTVTFPSWKYEITDPT